LLLIFGEKILKMRTLTHPRGTDS
jgi:hypothetical protein